MTKEEFFKKKEELRREFRKKEDSLEMEYASSNNQVKIGDLIRDHIGCGKVLSYKCTTPYGYNSPSMVYECVEYTVKGKPKKYQSERVIFQVNLIEINGVPYKYE